jgi:hypothetical protein
MARFVEAAHLKKGPSQEICDRGIETVFEGADGYYSPNGRCSSNGRLLIGGLERKVQRLAHHSLGVQAAEGNGLLLLWQGLEKLSGSQPFG